MKPVDCIPFLDLVTPHRELEEKLISVFREALRTATFIGGSMLQQFENAFAAFCETKHCVGVGSGTDALRLALIAVGVQPGDVVVTVPNTFIATAEAISQAGALPEFVDVDERTYNMDPEKLANYLAMCIVDKNGFTVSRRSARRIRAIVPVHLYGQMADMDPIMELAHRYGLLIIEDACQAHGAEYFSKRERRWKRAGSVALAGAFSFYPGKNLGACGEAGAVTTNDSSIAHRVRLLRDHGQSRKYYHDIEGYNGRLDAIQAGLLSAKLPYLPVWNDQRRHCARVYADLLSKQSGLKLPSNDAGSRPVFHLYIVRTERRDALISQLNNVGISTGIHYPIPLHLQGAYRSHGYSEGDFPVSERMAAMVVSLPMFPQLTYVQQLRVATEVLRFLSGEATKAPSAMAAHNSQATAV
jgi:dTDP-4-amino-4,6-dideoxygalactose transaminase